MTAASKAAPRQWPTHTPSPFISVEAIALASIQALDGQTTHKEAHRTDKNPWARAQSFRASAQLHTASSGVRQVGSGTRRGFIR